MKKPQLSLKRLMLWITSIATILGSSLLSIWLAFYVVAFWATIPLGRSICQFKNEWPKTTIISIGTLTYVLTLFAPIIAPETSPLWLIDGSTKFLALFLISAGIMLVRWNNEARTWAMTITLIFAALIFAISKIAF